MRLNLTLPAMASQGEDDPTNELYEQLARDQGLLDRLEDKVTQELISETTAKRNRSEIERRMEATRREISRRRGGEVVAHIPRNLREVWPDLSRDRRRAIVKAVLVNVTLLPQPNSARMFHPEKVVAEWRDQPAPERESV